MIRKNAWFAPLIAAALLHPVIVYACDEKDVPLDAVPQHIGPC